MLKQDDRGKFAEFAPALDEEPVYDRPGDGRYEEAHRPASDYLPGSITPAGVWADGRSVFGLESRGGLGFLDPGTFALTEHNSHMMEAHGIGMGAMECASSDLSAAFTDFGGGGGGGSGKPRGDGSAVGLWNGPEADAPVPVAARPPRTAPAAPKNAPADAPSTPDAPKGGKRGPKGTGGLA